MASFKVRYQGSLTSGEWKIIVSVDDLGSNTINVAGNINVLEKTFDLGRL